MKDERKEKKRKEKWKLSVQGKERKGKAADEACMYLRRKEAISSNF